MTKTLSQAFAEALDRTGMSEASVAQQCGMSLEQLRALTLGQISETNVDDAARLPRFFGVELEQFLGNPQLKSPIEIARLYNRLPDDLKRQFQVYASTQAGRSDPSDRE